MYCESFPNIDNSADKYGCSVSEIDMLEEALGYPFEDENRFTTLGIGGVLYIIGSFLSLFADVFSDDLVAIPLLLILFLGGFVLAGYSARVLRTTARGNETVPGFTDWRGLVIDGLKLTVVNIVYLLPTIVLFVVAISLRSDGGGPTTVVGVLSLTAFTIGLVALFFAPVAWTNVALTERLGAAFEFRTIIDAALTGQYLIAIGLLVVLGVIFRLVAGFLAIIFVGYFVLFYAQVVISYLIGTSCGPNLNETQEESLVAD
jgi:hypothetical protein